MIQVMISQMMALNDVQVKLNSKYYFNELQVNLRLHQNIDDGFQILFQLLSTSEL